MVLSQNLKKKLNKKLPYIFKYEIEYFTEPAPILKTEQNDKSDLSLTHIAAFIENGNSGDILLPRMVRDIFEFCSKKKIRWVGRHAHSIVKDNTINNFESKDGIIIGGGGLFLKDTNKNNLSGWQWSCSNNKLKKISKPIALFAVGYNRFRGQKDFKPVFKKSLKLLTEKSVYIGLRNHGSIKAIKSYLPEHLHQKIRYQPCPTTVAAKLYPDLIKKAKNKQENKVISINYADDRIGLRLGQEKDRILNDLSQCLLHFSNQGFEIKFFAHLPKDEKFLPYLDQNKVPYTLEKHYHKSPTEILNSYSQVTLAMGMRGHAQMIAFGCGTPNISLISHDKLAWFLEDIKRTNWGIEMKDNDFRVSLEKMIEKTIENKDNIEKDINEIQDYLMNVSQKNVDDYLSALNL